LFCPCVKTMPVDFESSWRGERGRGAGGEREEREGRGEREDREREKEEKKKEITHCAFLSLFSNS